MKTGKKLLTGSLLALCAALLVLCIVLAAGWSKAAKNDAATLPEVRNNGTAIQWKYSDETDWRDLVLLTELRGATGEAGKDGVNGENGTDGKDGLNGTNGQNGANGKDGINGLDGKDGADGKNGKDGIDGANGKDGINGKSIEVQRATEYIQWRYEGDEWQNLVAIADITGPAGQKGADGANGKTPEFRVNENTLQWRYVGDEIWLNLYDLTALKGADGRDGADGKDGINGKDGIDGKDGKDGTNGINGQDGRDGADGNTPFIGENGNWWIGEIDTGVKAVGTDGIDGTNGVDGEKGDKGDKGDPGDKGDKGEKGDKGDKGDAGQNGGCSGYFHAKASIGTALLQNHAARFEFTTKINKGGLISASANEITLKKGHIYNITISGSLGVSSNASDNSGFYGIQMTDSSEDADFCRNITRIKRDGTKLPYSNDYHFFNFNRMYDASARDITLKFLFEQSEYNTLLEGFSGTITITALD